MGSVLAFDQLARELWKRCRDAEGCRAVQSMLASSQDCDMRDALAYALKGNVYEACRCPHANHVLQRYIQVMSPFQVQFVVDEVLKHSSNLTRNKYGCRVVQRLLEV